jgi:hypothetical protein
MAEVELFRNVCGAAALASGEAFDYSSAERRRPIDLLDAMRLRGRGSGGLSITEGPRRDVPVALVYDGSSGSEEKVVSVGAVSAGGRRSIGLRLTLQTSGDTHAFGQLRWEVVDSLYRRRIFARVLNLKANEEMRIDATLPEHGGLLEISFILSSAANGRNLLIGMRTCSLARL